MAQRPQPSLRLADGGSFITRWAQNAMRANDMAGKPAGVRFQDGGVVPGSGRGDKIPAKYEPGEFVVSNDMIDDNPGLREQLSGLRAETLAARGKTVEEADAKALTGGRRPSLRADDGFGPIDRMARDLTGQNSLPPKSPVGNMADDLARNARAAAPVPPPGPANPGMANPQAQAAYDDMARAKAQPAAPAVEPAAPKSPGAGSKWSGSADDWKNLAKGPADSPHKTLRMTAPEAPRGLGKGLLAVQGAMGAKDAYDGIREGDAWKTGVGAADAVAGAALFTPAAPVAGAYLGLRGAWDTAKAAGGAIYDNLSEKARDVVGGTVNQIGLSTGLWGVDDSAKLMADAQARMAKPADTPRTTTPSAAPDPRNPYADANAAKIAAADAQNKAADAQNKAADAQKKAVPAAPPGYTNDVTRNGNEYSGTNVRGDITINGFAPGAGLNLGSGPNAQNMAAANNLAATDSLRSQGAVGALDGQGGMALPQAPTVRHSGNDWQARNDLRNLGVSASSITNRPEWQSGSTTQAWSTRGGGGVSDPQGKVAAYQAALKQDIGLRGAQSGVDLEMAKSNNSLRGQKLTADASRYGSDNSLRGQMYTADSQLGAKQLEMQQKLRQQQLMGGIYQAAGGDPVKAAKLAAGYGLDSKSFQDMAAADQTRTQGNVKDARSTFENMFTRDGKNGPERDENAEAMAHQLASQIVPGWENMSAEQRAANRTKVVDATRVVQNMNTLRNTGWLQKAGIDAPTPAYSQLPDLGGATVSDVGFWEGLTTPDVRSGDKKISLRNGDKRYLPQGTLTESQLRLLQNNGAVRQ